MVLRKYFNFFSHLPTHYLKVIKHIYTVNMYGDTCWTDWNKKCLKIPKVIRGHNSKKDRQCNGQKKRDIMTNNGVNEILHRKLKIEQHEPH
jgi:hypothetical protein